MKIEWRKVTWYSKVLALIFFILLSLIGFYLGMKYQQTISKISVSQQTITRNIQADNSANWQTYRNDEYGFEMKYPQGWFINESKLSSVTANRNDLSYQISIADYNQNINARSGEPPKNNILIDIYIISRISYSNIESWMNAAGYKKISNLSIDGKMAIDSESKETVYSEMYERVVDEYSRNIRVINGNTGYEIYWSPVDSELKNVFDQILSTFKFTK